MGRHRHHRQEPLDPPPPPPMLGVLQEETLRRLLATSTPPHAHAPGGSAAGHHQPLRHTPRIPSSTSKSSSPISFSSSPSSTLSALDRQRRQLEARAQSLRRTLLSSHFHHQAPHEKEEDDAPPPPQPPPILLPSPAFLQYNHYDDNHAAIAARWVRTRRADVHRAAVVEARALRQWQKWLQHRRATHDLLAQADAMHARVHIKQALRRIRQRTQVLRRQHLTMLRVVLLEKEEEQQQQQHVVVHTRAVLRMWLQKGLRRWRRRQTDARYLRELEEWAVQGTYHRRLKHMGLEAFHKNNGKARRRQRRVMHRQMDAHFEQWQQQRALRCFLTFVARSQRCAVVLDKGSLWWDLRGKEQGLRRWHGQWCHRRRETRRMLREMDAYWEDRQQRWGLRQWLHVYMARRRTEKARLRKADKWRRTERAWVYWVRQLGKACRRRQREQWLLVAVDHMHAKACMKRALLRQWQSTWLRGLVAAEKAVLARGHKHFSHLVATKVLDRWKEGTARRLLLRTHKQQDHHKPSLLRKCLGWQQLLTHHQETQKMIGKGDKHYQGRATRKALRQWISHVLARRRERAALETIERSLDPRQNPRQHQQQQQQSQSQTQPAGSPTRRTLACHDGQRCAGSDILALMLTVPPSPSLPFLVPAPQRLDAMYQRVTQKKLSKAWGLLRTRLAKQAHQREVYATTTKHHLHRAFSLLRQRLQHSQERLEIAMAKYAPVVFKHRLAWALRQWRQQREAKQAIQSQRKALVEAHLKEKGQIRGLGRLFANAVRHKRDEKKMAKAIAHHDGGAFLEGKAKRRWLARQLRQGWAKWQRFHAEQQAGQQVVAVRERVLARHCMRQWVQALHTKTQEEWAHGALHRLLHRWHHRAHARTERRRRLAAMIAAHHRTAKRRRALRRWQAWIEGRKQQVSYSDEVRERIGAAMPSVHLKLALGKWRRWTEKKQRRREQSQVREGLYHRRQSLRAALFQWGERTRNNLTRDRWQQLAVQWHRKQHLLKACKIWQTKAEYHGTIKQKRRALARMETRAAHWRLARVLRRWQHRVYVEQYVRCQWETAVDFHRGGTLEGHKKKMKVKGGGRQGMDKKKKEVIMNTHKQGKRGFFYLRRLALHRQAHRQGVETAVRAWQLMRVARGWQRWRLLHRRKQWSSVQERLLGCWKEDRLREWLWRWREWTRQRKEQRLVGLLMEEVQRFQRSQQSSKEERE